METDLHLNEIDISENIILRKKLKYPMNFATFLKEFSQTKSHERNFGISQQFQTHKVHVMKTYEVF